MRRTCVRTDRAFVSSSGPPLASARANMSSTFDRSSPNSCSAALLKGASSRAARWSNCFHSIVRCSPVNTTPRLRTRRDAGNSTARFAFGSTEPSLTFGPMPPELGLFGSTTCASVFVPSSTAFAFLPFFPLTVFGCCGAPSAVPESSGTISSSSSGTSSPLDPGRSAGVPSALAGAVCSGAPVSGCTMGEPSAVVAGMVGGTGGIMAVSTDSITTVDACASVSSSSNSGSSSMTSRASWIERTPAATSTITRLLVASLSSASAAKASGSKRT